MGAEETSEVVVASSSLLLLSFPVEKEFEMAKPKAIDATSEAISSV